MEYKSVIFMVLFIVITVTYLYYWQQAISQAKNRNAFMFFNWFYLFMPNEFNDVGNDYRKKSLICFLLLIFEGALVLTLS